jgi:hypothetical protein
LSYSGTQEELHANPDYIHGFGMGVDRMNHCLTQSNFLSNDQSKSCVTSVIEPFMKKKTEHFDVLDNTNTHYIVLVILIIILIVWWRMETKK